MTTPEVQQVRVTNQPNVIDIAVGVFLGVLVGGLATWFLLDAFKVL